jgi:hypothetical protein
MRSCFGFKLRWSLALAALFSIGVTSSTSSHTDPPGQPKLNVSEEVVKLTLLQDMDDGVGINTDAEVFLVVHINHTTHGATSKNYQNDNVDWDTSPTWNIGNIIWSHDECTPRQAVVAAAAVTEIDNDLPTNIAGGLAGAVAGLVIGAVVGDGPGAVAGAIGGFIIGLLPSFNGNDDLGFAANLVPANGVLVLNTVGADGSTNVEIKDVTANLGAHVDCSLMHVPALPPPDQRSGMIFPPLKDGALAAMAIEIEAGNPGQLSAEENANIRSSWRQLFGGLAEIGAGTEIDNARSWQGVNQALPFFAQAQALYAAGQDSAAIALFDSAFVRAASATADSVPAPQTRLPFQVSVVPRTVATLPSRSPLIMAAGLGAVDSASIAVVSGLPPGMTALPSKVQAGSSVYMISIDIDAFVEPGQYNLTVRATEGTQFDDQTVTILVGTPTTGVETPRVPDYGLALRIGTNPIRGANPLAYELEVEEATNVRVTVHDLAGRVIAVLQDGMMTPGRAQKQWNGTGSMASGMYILRATTGSRAVNRRFVLVK